MMMERAFEEVKARVPYEDKNLLKRFSIAKVGRRKKKKEKKLQYSDMMSRTGVAIT